MEASETIFSKIIRREIPANIVYETETVLAFRDVNPQAKTHVLIIPKKIIPDVNQVSDADKLILGELFIAARDIAKAEGLLEGGYRLVVNTGADAGQTVFHIHMHLLGGRSLAWPPG